MVEHSRTIDFAELKAFEAVVRLRGITAAAEALGLSKSTVSLQISRLERRLGIRLFERSSRRVEPTREGERLLSRVRALLDDAEQLFDDSERDSGAPRGAVRMAVSPALGSAVLERLVPALQARHPGVRLVVVSRYGYEDLRDPAFDLALRVGHVRDEGLVARKVGAFHRVLVCAPGHPATTLASPTDLRGTDLLAFSGDSTRVELTLERADRSPGAVHVAVDARVAIHDFAALQRLARGGLGVAVLPDFMVQADLDAGLLARVLPAWQSPQVEVLLARRTGASRLRRVAVVLEAVEDVVATLIRGA